MSRARSRARRLVRDAAGRWLHALIDRGVAERLGRELPAERERIADEAEHRRARVAILEDLQVVRFPRPLGRNGGILPAAEVETDAGRLYLRADEHEQPDELSAAADQLREALDPGMTVLVAGAGYLALVAAAAVSPEGRVVAVEEDPRALRLLRANLARHGLYDVATGHARESGVLALLRAEPAVAMVLDAPGLASHLEGLGYEVRATDGARPLLLARPRD